MRPFLRRLADAVANIDTWKIVACLYLLAVIVNVAFGLEFRHANSFEQLEEDEKEYVRAAAGLLDGSFELNGRRTLGYPLLLAGIQRIAPSFTATQICVSLIYALAIPLTFAAVRKMTGNNLAGITSALVLLVWPPAIFYGNSLYSESAALPCALFLLTLLPVGFRSLSASRGARYFSFLAAGAALALATHVRPMYMLFAPVLLLIIAIETHNLKRALPHMAMALAGFVMLILPWSFYLSSKVGTPVFVSAGAGETLAGGLNPNILKSPSQFITVRGNRHVWQGPGKWVVPQETGFITQAELKLPYVQWSALLKQRAMAWALENPRDAAYIQMRKLSYMWGIYPLLDNGKQQFIFGNIPTLALLAFTIFLAFSNRRLILPYSRFLLLPFFVTGVALISWGSWRFRMIGDVGLIAFCVSAICHWAGIIPPPLPHPLFNRQPSDHRHSTVDV